MSVAFLADFAVRFFFVTIFPFLFYEHVGYFNDQKDNEWDTSPSASHKLVGIFQSGSYMNLLEGTVLTLLPKNRQTNFFSVGIKIVEKGMDR